MAKFSVAKNATKENRTTISKYGSHSTKRGDVLGKHLARIIAPQQRVSS